MSGERHNSDRIRSKYRWPCNQSCLGAWARTVYFVEFVRLWANAGDTEYGHQCLILGVSSRVGR